MTTLSGWNTTKASIMDNSGSRFFTKDMDNGKITMYTSGAIDTEDTMARKENEKRKTATELSSGKYRVQVFVGLSPDGKRKYKSFLGATPREAAYKAEEWKKNRPASSYEITLKEAAERYIASKKAVLSAATIRGYTFIVNKHLNGSFGKLKLSEITNPILQVWISELLEENQSSKSVRNKWGFVSAVLDFFIPEFKKKVTLPDNENSNRYCPNDNDVKLLLKLTENKPEMHVAIMLAAFGTLRRGEVCALTPEDIHGRTISINKGIVRDKDGIYQIKPPKTPSSNRVVELPEFVIEELRKLAEGKNPNERLITMNPDSLSPRFCELVEAAGLPKFSFHGLRHYSASKLHAIGVPDQYIMSRGGWKSDHVMKAVYRNVISLEEKKQTSRIINHFDKTFSIAK